LQEAQTVSTLPPGFSGTNSTAEIQTVRRASSYGFIGQHMGSRTVARTASELTSCDPMAMKRRELARRICLDLCRRIGSAENPAAAFETVCASCKVPAAASYAKAVTVELISLFA